MDRVVHNKTSAVVPASLTDRVSHLLANTPQHERATFALRLERYWPDLIDGLAAAYGDHAPTLAERAVMLAARAYEQRPATLKARDEQRTITADWFQHPDMFGYAAYADRYVGDGSGLRGVRERLDHLADLGVTYLHLMPLLEPRPEPNDGGYAVANYREVREDLGTIDDLRALTTELHAHGINLCLDLVLNHVAREHAWAQRAARGERHYRDYFWIFPDRTEPDRYEATLPEVFPDFAPGSFTWDDDVDGWVWSTFNAYQWDLNWSNPDVFAEMLDVVLYLANAGVDVLRLDAIAFIWKRLGTNCQNQPEVHAITQALRSVVRIACPATVFLAEAIVAPADLVTYLGRGRHHGKVSDLAYHNSLMVQIWSMLASRDVSLAAHALNAIPSIPATTSWLTYVRCHDDIGWAISDQDAAAVGLSGHDHRAFLSDFYSGDFDGSFADGLVFQHNPATGDRRISGSAASLTGIAPALANGDVTHAQHGVRRLLLAYALISFWGGIPVIWSGDEIAMPNDPDWADDHWHAQDNRWAHRPALDWALVEQAHAAGPRHAADPHEIADQRAASAAAWNGLRRIQHARKSLPHLHAATPARASEAAPGVLAVRRDHPLGTVIGLFNVTEHVKLIDDEWLRAQGLDPQYCWDALAAEPAPKPANPPNPLTLEPYAVRWLRETEPDD